MSLQNNKFAIQTALAVAAREARDRILAEIEIDDPGLDARVAEWRGVLEARKYQGGYRADTRIEKNA